MKSKYKVRIYKYVLTIMVMLAFMSIPAMAAPNPSIDANGLSPSSKNVGDSGFTLSVTGNNYDNTALVMFGTTTLVTTFVDNKHLTAIVPSANLVTAGTILIKVHRNSDGKESGTMRVRSIKERGTT